MSTSEGSSSNGPLIIDGNATAKTIREEVKEAVQALKEKTGKVPGLGVILVGGRTDSATYVRMKQKAAEEVGMHFVMKHLPEDISEEDLIKEVHSLNQDDSVHGYLVQLPLPSHINEKRVLHEVSQDKDVDGFHPLNMGQLALKGHTPRFIPCTPKGCMELLKRYNIPLEGKKAVVLGRSNIVGVPMALLLMHANATVTVCHSRTKDIAAECRQADILVAAIGQTEFVKEDWVKEGAVVIDVGINSKPDSSRKSGYRLVGDVEFEGVKRRAGAITPVPGGVGPMTVAMLLQGTLESAQRTLTA
ncbi:methenyltetrahydrofolate cyclohydrolase [Balamuthia mandrillaris]